MSAALLENTTIRLLVAAATWENAAWKTTSKKWEVTQKRAPTPFNCFGALSIDIRTNEQRNT
eukprot:1139460-Pelagomonas_calceolata.AAC.5